MSNIKRWNLIAADPDPSLRSVLSKVLPADRFVHFEATTTREVIDVLKSNTGFSLVLLELSLCSDVGIIECTREIMAASSKARVIITTTRPLARIKPAMRDLPNIPVLRKPFRLHDLRQAVSTALNISEAEFSLPSASRTTLPDKQPSAPSAAHPALTARLADESTFDLLFQELEKRQPLEEGMDAFDVVEKHLIERALQSCSGNQSRTARFLGITRNTLRKRIRKYGFSGALVDED